MPASWVVAFIGPVLLAHYVWDEDLNASFHLNMIRYVLGLHVNWSINSFAHIHGMRPFDRNNSSRDSRLFGFLAFGEGWHNFHHVSEMQLPMKLSLTMRTWFIAGLSMGLQNRRTRGLFLQLFHDFHRFLRVAWWEIISIHWRFKLIIKILGWATDLKTVSPETIKARVLRTGDGTHPYSIEQFNKNCMAPQNNVNNNNEGERDLDHFWGWVSCLKLIKSLNLIWF